VLFRHLIQYHPNITGVTRFIYSELDLYPILSANEPWITETYSLTFENVKKWTQKKRAKAANQHCIVLLEHLEIVKNDALQELLLHHEEWNISVVISTNKPYIYMNMFVHYYYHGIRDIWCFHCPIYLWEPYYKKLNMTHDFLVFCDIHMNSNMCRFCWELQDEQQKAVYVGWTRAAIYNPCQLWRRLKRKIITYLQLRLPLGSDLSYIVLTYL